MDERRIQPRMLCAELVEVQWRDKSSRQRRSVANLEDISLTGACIHLESGIVRGSVVSIFYGDGELKGEVRYCLYRDFGYFLGIQFTEGCRWSRKHFKPSHMLDPRTLVQRAVRRAAQTQANAS